MCRYVQREQPALTAATMLGASVNMPVQVHVYWLCSFGGIVQNHLSKMSELSVPKSKLNKQVYLEKYTMYKHQTFG